MSSTLPAATKTGCPKNNNKEASDRFMAFCISADALRLKLAPQNHVLTKYLVNNVMRQGTKAG